MGIFYCTAGGFLMKPARFFEANWKQSSARGMWIEAGRGRELDTNSRAPQWPIRTTRLGQELAARHILSAPPQGSLKFLQKTVAILVELIKIVWSDRLIFSFKAW